jgi:hypothetical protein
MCDLSAEDSINQTGRNSQPSFRALPKEALLYMSGFRQTVSTVLIQTVPLPKITCERCGGHIEYPIRDGGTVDPVFSLSAHDQVTIAPTAAANNTSVLTSQSEH